MNNRMSAIIPLAGLVCLIVPSLSIASEPAAAAGPCPLASAVAEIVEAHLPAFALPSLGPATGTPCAQFASGDFNGDGTKDLAAVLTERAAPRKYSDGTDHFSSYVFVFLTAKLPYSDHEAVLLLGHESTPRRISLQAVRSGSSTRDRLIVTNASYSRTVYEWRSTGFVAQEHSAD
jgi:hypothetical protein